MNDIETTLNGLMKLANQSQSGIVQIKVKDALSKIKRAKTLVEQAEATLLWAENYDATIKEYKD